MVRKTTLLDAVNPLNPTTKEVKAINKRNRLFQSNVGVFVDVTCASCETVRICYSHSQAEIFCKSCGDLILIPSGGKAKVADKCTMKVHAREF